jgi:23S rRNA (pseudouridine1915-N3)-methyltransferase
VVLSVGRLRHPFLDDVAHYRRLLSRYARVEELELSDGADVARRLPPRRFVSLLASDGLQYDSVAFSRFLEQRRQDGRELAFVLGGPWGLEDPPVADHRLSFGALTLPHQLARVVLLEQLYRAHKILAGEPYHH